MSARGPVLAAAAAAGALAAAALAWPALRAPLDGKPAGETRAPRALPADAASREADDIVEAVRRGRLSSALAGVVSFLARFLPADLDPERQAALEEARLAAGRWGLSEAETLAGSGDADAADAVLAKALRALSGTPAEGEGAAAAARVRAQVERAHGEAAARARAEALAPVEKAVEAARAKAAKGIPEEALADLLGLLPGTTQTDARHRLEGEVETLRRRVSARKERAELRKRADAAIAKGDYEAARKILAGLAEGGGPEPDPAEAAKDREKLDAVKDLEENREPEALAACRKALRWLAKQQIDDGSFSVPVLGADGKKVSDDQRKKAQYRTGLTGLAALALLGHVRYDVADEFAPSLDRALAWLLGAQKKDGSFTGNIYEDAIAGLVLVEADRLLHRSEVKPAAAKALEWLQDAQGADGGWRYRARFPTSDVSVTGWVLQALLHAKMGDYELRPFALDQALGYLDRLTDPVTGRVRYDDRPGPGSLSMTAAALFCRLRNGLGPDDERVRLAAEFLLRTPPGSGLRDNAYALFYASDAMSRLGGDAWRKWGPALKKLLLQTQNKDGDAAGSWPSTNDPWGKQAGAIYVVALNAISLENFFEHRE